MYITRKQQLNKMIRYFYSLCLVLVCVVLPTHAGANAMLPISSSDAVDNNQGVSHKPSKTSTVSKEKTTSTAATSVKESKTSETKTASAKESKTPETKIASVKEAKTSETKTVKASTTTASVKETKAPETKTASIKETKTPEVKAEAKTTKVAEASASKPTLEKKHVMASSTTKSTPDGSSKGSASSSRRLGSIMGRINGRLARLTAYWAGEGDYYTGHGISATGVRLHDGHCAVDPSVIPYGSQVEISGLGTYLAVDTGSAVITRKAARETGHTSEERNALVIDLYFESRRDGERFAANGPKFASISWRSPREADNQTKESAGLVAEESWNKNHSL
jgi:3D (Asp-Asp-Asp) domain-containing protein